VLLQENVPLAPLTTLGVGGPARYFAEVATPDDVRAAVHESFVLNLRLFVLGGGSNLVISDQGWPGLVLKVATRGIDWRRENGNIIFEAGAGEEWDALVAAAVKQDCAGIECLSGIPGTVGGTPVQNVGAYGQEVATVIERVRAFDLQKHAFVEFSAVDCGFAYRRSRFNETDRGRYAVTRVDYRLAHGGVPSLKYADLQREFPSGTNPTLKQVAETVRRVRQSKGMLIVDGDPDSRSAGSFFKNPIVNEAQARHVALAAGAEPPQFTAGPDHPNMVKLSAAWLIERAGFPKGYALGRAGVSTKHTLALVNRGGATAAEILALADKIRSAIAASFGIELHMEPVMVGFDR
jgi:UDP-N-acetylmuramate dehydrogenase